MTTQYGAIVGLTKLGPLVIDSVLEPLVCEGDYVSRLELASNAEIIVSEKSNGVDEKIALKEEATRVLLALKQAARRSSVKRFKQLLGGDDGAELPNAGS